MQTLYVGKLKKGGRAWYTTLPTCGELAVVMAATAHVLHCALYRSRTALWMVITLAAYHRDYSVGQFKIILLRCKVANQDRDHGNIVSKKEKEVHAKMATHTDIVHGRKTLQIRSFLNYMGNSRGCCFNLISLGYPE